MPVRCTSSPGPIFASLIVRSSKNMLNGTAVASTANSGDSGGSSGGVVPGLVGHGPERMPQGVEVQSVAPVDAEGLQQFRHRGRHRVVRGAGVPAVPARRQERQPRKGRISRRRSGGQGFAEGLHGFRTEGTAAPGRRRSSSRRWLNHPPSRSRADRGRLPTSLLPRPQLMPNRIIAFSGCTPAADQAADLIGGVEGSAPARPGATTSSSSTAA